MAHHGGEHVAHKAQALRGGSRVRDNRQTILRGGPRHKKLTPQRGGKGPDASLHHHLGHIPDRLHFNDLVAFIAVELVVAHRDDMARRRNIQPRAGKGADVMSTRTQPRFAIVINARHYYPVAALKIGQGLQQGRKGAVIKRIRPGHVTQRLRQVDHSLWREHPPQSRPHRRFGKIAHGVPNWGEQLFGVGHGHTFPPCARILAKRSTPNWLNRSIISTNTQFSVNLPSVFSQKSMPLKAILLPVAAVS